MSDESSDISQDKSFKQTARNEALSAAEKGLKAAQNALSAAEKKLAEAQRNYQNAENNVAAAQSSSAAAENAANSQGQTDYVPDWQPVSNVSNQEQNVGQAQATQNQARGSAGTSASMTAEAAPGSYTGSSAAQSEQPEQIYELPQEPQESQGQQVPYTPVQPHYEAPYASPKDHVAAGLLAIFLGGFGIHKFYLGYNTQGFIMLAITILAGIFTVGMASGIVWIVAIIEGIIYLTKSQSEFERIYVYGRREWF